jgi:uncharacterized membrane protein
MKTRNALAATAAAALFLAGFAGAASADDKASEGLVKCEGVNSCKGHSDCKTAENSCKGKNGCGGKGFKMMSQADCDAAKAKASKTQ